MDRESLALLIALIAVFFGPIVQYRIAKRQIRATVLSANRQKWIDQVRTHIAEFMALCGSINLRKTSDKTRAEMNDSPSKIDRLYLIKFNIALLMNPNEEDHKDLCSLLDQAVSITAQPAQNDTELESTLEKIRNTCQAILKREWVRVKDLS
jgi:hypothetical protein